MKKLAKLFVKAIPFIVIGMVTRAISSTAGFQALTASVIFAGLLFGPEVAAITGIGGTLASTAFLPMGVWVFPQMALWVALGVGSGLLNKKIKKENIFQSTVLGYVSCFMYGVSMDFIMWFIDPWYKTVYSNPLNAIIGGLPYDVRSAMFSTAFITMGSAICLGVYAYKKVRANAFATKTVVNIESKEVKVN